MKRDNKIFNIASIAFLLITVMTQFWIAFTYPAFKQMIPDRQLLLGWGIPCGIGFFFFVIIACLLDYCLPKEVKK